MIGDLMRKFFAAKGSIDAVLDSMWHRIDREPAVPARYISVPKKPKKQWVNHQARYKQLKRSSGFVAFGRKVKQFVQENPSPRTRVFQAVYTRPGVQTNSEIRVLAA